MSSSRSRLQSARTVAPRGGCEAPVSAASAMIRGSAASPGSAAKPISATAWSEGRGEQHERLALEVDQPAQAGGDEAERERVGGRGGAAGRERARDLVRAEDEDEADRAHRQPPDQRGRERRSGARRAQRREEAAAGGGGDGHRCQCRPEPLADQKRFGERRIFGDTARRDRLPLRPRGPAPHALRDLAAVRAAGERGGACATPARYSVHLPWVRAARERLAGFDYAMLDALLPERGYAPDFFAPPPRSPLPDVAEELERVRATDPVQVRRELGWRFGGDVPDGRAAAARRHRPRHRDARRRDGRLLGAGAGAVVGPGARAARGGHPPPRRAPGRRRRARAVRGAARGRALALAARSRSSRSPTPRSCSTAAGCSSSRPRSCGRAPARCSTRRGSRA